MKKIELSFTELEVYGNYVISRTKEGMDVDIAMHEGALVAVAQELEAPWGLMLDMVNSFSTQLPVIHAVRDNPDIHSVAIVCYREESEIAMRQATEMIRKPAMITRDLGAARTWLENQ